MNKEIIYKIIDYLPFGEKRTFREIKQSLQNKHHFEHDYLKSIYEDLQDE